MDGNCSFEFMEYMNEDAIDPNLICSICTKAFINPVHTPCDHTFGRQCITQWLSDKDHNSCPLCNKRPLLTKELVQASRPLRNILDQIRVRCTLCNQIDIQRGNFQDHIEKLCPKAEVQCKAVDIKCPWKGLRDELPDHLLTCVFEPLRPVLSFLIKENHELTVQIQKQKQQLDKLSLSIAHPAKNAPAVAAAAATITTEVADDDSDASSMSEYSVGDSTEDDGNAVFIQNLPPTVKFNDLFDIFSQCGRIKYNEVTKKAVVLIFKKRQGNDEKCSAKVVYEDKRSVAAAITKYHNKHVPQWNTRIRVIIWKSKKPTKRNNEKPTNQNSTNLCAAATPNVNNQQPKMKCADGSCTIQEAEESDGEIATPENSKKKRNRRRPGRQNIQDEKVLGNPKPQP